MEMKGKSSHYFIADESLRDDEQRISFYYGGNKLEFFTNSGLFSPDKIDGGTQILLENMPSLKGTLLDLGCGYGPIGISLLKSFPLKVTMADINERAIRYAQKNLELNKAEADVFLSDGFKDLDKTLKFDNIVLNPPIHAGKEKIFEMYHDSINFLNDGGSFYIVIQKKHGALSSMAELNEIYKTAETLYKKKGIYVWKYTK